jgi:hypothetical protein
MTTAAATFIRHLSIFLIVVGAAVHLLVPSPALARQSQPPAATVAPCVVSDDPQYGFSKDQPVQVGGSPMFGAARQRRYLDALRGPAGQPVQYKRTGSTVRLNDDTVLDAYEVTYDGLEQPLTLYLDWYHLTETRAPRGFTCAQPFNLGLPPPDPFLAKEQLDALAISKGSDPAFTPTPISIGEPSVALVFDRFQIVALGARAAVASGSPLDAKRLPAFLNRPRTVVLVPPLKCDDRSVAAKGVAIVDTRGATAPSEPTTDVVPVDRLLPGIAIPSAGLTGVFAIEGLRAGLSLKITYAEPACPSRMPDVTLPIPFTPARLIESPMPAMPDGEASPVTWIALQALVDDSGRFRSAVSLGGPPGLAKAAATSLDAWRAEPARVNGSPVVVPVVLQVTFRK